MNLVDEIIKEKRKTLVIKVKKDGTVLVKAPLNTSDKRIFDFIEQKVYWIEKTRAKLKALSQENVKTIDENKILLFYKQFAVSFDNVKRPIIYEDYVVFPSNYKENFKQKITAFYKKQAKIYLKERLDFYCQQLNVKYKILKIGSAKTRWGSCNAKGTIILNYKLMCMPKIVIDYVVLHETAHLIHLNHSKAFWKTVERVMPNYKECKTWLKTKGSYIEII